MAQFFDGFLTGDVRHNLKVHASYVFHGFNIGGLINYITAEPSSKHFYNYNDQGFTNLRAPTGNDPIKPNDPRAFAELRGPDLLVVNLRVSYDFHELIKQHVILIADFFNLFNLSTPTSFENTDIPTYGVVGSRQTPFRFQLGLRYIY
jgi:hypothetical protein